MMKSNLPRKFLIFLIIFTVFVGNVQIRTYTKVDTLNSAEVKSSAMQINLAAWIIIAGDRESDHAAVTQIKQGSDTAYFILASRGFSTNDIMYLGPAWDTQLIYHSFLQDDVATCENIEWAIKTWAPTRGVDATHGLGIYLFDHGGTNSMAITGPNLADSSLNTWLDELEASSGCNRMVIIYEACHAGSFIDPISKHNRIVITSTDSAGSAYASSSWAYFSEKFFSSIIACKTIGECFEDAVAYVEALDVTEYPMIDDNHDETGHQVDAWGNLPNGGDGSDALNYWIGTGSNCPITLIQWLPLKCYVSIQAPIAPMWAVVKNDSAIKKVYVRVIPPDWVPPVPPQPDDDGIKMIPDGILPQYLHDTYGDGNYTGFLYTRDFKTKKGDYKVTLHAESEDGSVADIESTYITLNDDGTTPADTTPPTISITHPSNGANISGIVEVTAEGDDDQALDKIQIYIDGVKVKKEAMPSYYPYPEVSYSLNTNKYVNGTHNITATAIDKANNTKSTSITADFGIVEEKEEGWLERIPGYNIYTLYTGTLLGVIIVFTRYRKRRHYRKHN